MNHPCKDTCSGWAQGFEAGQADGIAKIRELEQSYIVITEFKAAQKRLVEAQLKRIKELEDLLTK